MNKKSWLVILIVVLVSFLVYYNYGVGLSPKSSPDSFRAWPFDYVGELALPIGAECTLGCGGNLNDHECIDPADLGKGSLRYALGNSDSGGSNPFIAEAPDGTMAAKVDNSGGPDIHSRVVVAMPNPNPDVYYVGFDFYIESGSFSSPIPNSHQIFSMRSIAHSGGCIGPSNQQSNKLTIKYGDVKDYIQLDNWARFVVKHDVQSGVVEILSGNVVILTYDNNFSPGEQSHQFQLRSRKGSYGAIWFNNLAVGTNYKDVLNYRGTESRPNR